MPFKSTKTCCLVSQVVLRRKGLTSKTQAPGEQQLSLPYPLLPGEQVPTHSIPCCLWSRNKGHRKQALPHLSALQAQWGSGQAPGKPGPMLPVGRKKRGYLCFSEWQLQSPETMALRHPEAMLGLLGSAAFGL